MDDLIKKPEWVFVIFGFIFGLLMMFITPPFLVPDEHEHVLRACEVSQGILYNKTPALPNKCEEKLSSELQIHHYDSFYSASAYSPVLYLSSALGLKIGSHWGGKTMFYIGRFFNLFVWICLIALAIRITPVFKYLFLFTALLPMSVYEGMSYAADSFNNAFVFLFFAYIFKLIFEKRDITKSNMLILFVFSIISAFTKGAIYPNFLFVFLPMKKYKWQFVTSIFLISFALMSLWSANNVIYVNPAVNTDYQKYLLIHNPLNFVITYLKSSISIENYLKSLIGILGWLNIRFASVFYVVTSVIFCLCFIFIPEKKITDKYRIFSLGVFVCFITILHLMYYIIWTAPSDEIIHGIQGRYFIPILPFIFLILAQSKDYFSQKIKNNYKIFLIVYIFGMLSYACYVLIKHYVV